MISTAAALDFVLPRDLAAREPPEARGLGRDEVKLMISNVRDDSITNTRFFHFPEFLDRGDVLVVNTSATINAALDSGDVSLNLSSPISGKRWVVEVRRNSEKGTVPFFGAKPGDEITLPANGRARLIEPFTAGENAGKVRLWIADLELPTDAPTFAEQHGSPVRYEYVPRAWPLSFYQTIFAREPGSAEMPSAGRPFTREIVARLERKGVTIAPILLHTGVSSLESDEPPYPERYSVPASTARTVNEAHARGSRVVAVGTTVVRALETAALENGTVRPASGWTDLVITPERGVRSVDAILTGLHAPRASHLSMLEAFAPLSHLGLAYDNALTEEYLWHEFGDVHLLLS